MIKKNFNSVLIIGMGLMGSSLSRAIYKNHLATNVFGIDTNEDVIKKCEKLNLLVQINTDINNINSALSCIAIDQVVQMYRPKVIWDTLFLPPEKINFVSKSHPINKNELME